MNKSLVMLLMTVGSTIGAYAPMIFGISSFSYTSLLTSLLGGVAGVWLAFKITG